MSDLMLIRLIEALENCDPYEEPSKVCDLARNAAAALRPYAERERVLVEALEPFAREGDIPDGVIPDDASLMYLNAARRLYASDLRRARAAIHSPPA